MSSQNRTRLLAQVKDRKISATIRTHDRQLAYDAVQAAVAGGFRMVEFTLTTPGAIQLISQFAKNSELLVAAGTILTTDQARQAVDAGACWIVSPVFDPDVVACAHELDVLCMPGTFTPTEMQTAHRAGADLVKLFPAPADVADHVRSILGPMPYLNIFPTAGVAMDNLTDVLEAGAVGAAFVRSLFDPHDLEHKNFKAIEQCAAAIVHRLKA